MVEILGVFIFSNLLYRLHEKFPELDITRFHRVPLSLVLATLPQSVTKALNIVRPQPPPVEETEFEEGEDVVMQSDSQLVLSSSYRSLSLLFSTTG